MLKNMKIGLRLGLSFGLILAALAAVGAYAISRVSSLNAAIEVVVSDRMVKVRQSNVLINNTNIAARTMRNMILLEDPAKIKEEQVRLDEVSAANTKTYDSLEATVTDSDGKKLLATASEARKNYADARKKTIELILQSQKSEATALLFGELRITQAAYLKAIEELIAYQTNLAQDDGKAAALDAATLERVLLVVIGALVLFGIFVAWILTRSIVKPIGQCIDIAGKVARGETDMDIQVNSTDETGKLMGAMRQMVDAIQLMTHDANQLAVAAKEGRLSVRADANKHEGDFRKIIEGVNNTLDSVIGPLNMAARYVDDISKGNIPAKITDSYNGDFNQIKNNLNICIDAVNSLVKDADLLVQAALDGRLATRADASRHQGDFRKIVQGVNDTLDAVIGPVNEAAETLDKVAARDMTARMQGSYNGDLAKIKNSLNLAVDNLEQALSQVAGSSQQVASASGQISSGSQSLAAGANEQASSLEEVSASLEEMSSMTRQNAENAIQAKNLSGEADQNAKQGTEAMERMSSSILKIKESSDQTAKIVKTIDEIAMQTNLLALNAAVEAARAGEAGRGFAVVAEEVRNLAQRSAQAAKNTADMIGESVKNADDGVKISRDVARSFEQITTSSRKVNDLIAEIAAASKEQAVGIKQVNDAVSQMDKVTQQNAANAEESASASEELSSQAAELQAMVNQFRLAKVAPQGMTMAHASPKRLSPPKPALDAPRKPKVVSADELIPMNEEVLKDF